MTRRANNEGSIRQREDGKWEASIQLDGKRYWRRGKTRGEVRLKLADVQKQYGAGELVSFSRLTLGQHLADWLEAGKGEWKPKTYHEYSGVVRLYLVPSVGHIPLQRLTTAHLAGAFARWRAEKVRAGGTLLNVHRVLHRALTIAVRWGRVGRNVADGLEPPRAVRRRPKLWAAGDAGRFLASEEDVRWGALWALLLGTGCRLGEAVGLRWDDIDRDLGVVTISRSLTWVGREAVEGEPKTEAGSRTLTLPPFALETLRRWRVVQATEQLAAGPGWCGAGRVLTLADGSAPSPWVCRNPFRRPCKRAELPHLRLHDLRHLHASLLLAEGLSLPAVSARLGHVSPAVTAAIYSHALKGHDSAAATAIEAAMRVAR